jgi:predicted RNA-binding protein with PUA-like domain
MGIGGRTVPNRWLFKTEPSTYSFQKLQAEKRTTWDGVKNSLALRHLSAVRKGDSIFIYHTGDEKAVVGLARAVSEAYPDPKQKDPRLLVIDIEAVGPLRKPVSLSALKANPKLGSFDLVRLPRLSVMPVSEEPAREIEKLADAT